MSVNSILTCQCRDFPYVVTILILVLLLNWISAIFKYYIFSTPLIVATLIIIIYYCAEILQDYNAQIMVKLTLMSKHAVSSGNNIGGSYNVL